MKIEEMVLNEAYQSIENAVWILAEYSELNATQKANLVDDFFAKLIQECDIEEVD